LATAYDYARALVKALRESDEGRQMRALGAKVSKDAKLEKLLAEFRMAQLEVQAAQLQGQEPSKEQIGRLQKLAQTAEGQNLLKDYLLAENAYGQLLTEVQQVLAEAFNPEVPGSIRQKR
jgi:cell fate (sporulation/competence/biofilm development) regulator YlbF (YheA/YmcA/DUF963 family)